MPDEDARDTPVLAKRGQLSDPTGDALEIDESKLGRIVLKFANRKSEPDVLPRRKRTCARHVADGDQAMTAESAGRTGK